MYIESVKMLKTVKAGKKIFLEGVVLTPPLPKEILDEIIMHTGTVHVVGLPPPKPTKKKVFDMVSVPEMKTPDLRVKQLEVETQTQTQTKVIPPEPEPAKPKKLLVQRRRGGKKK